MMYEKEGSRWVVKSTSGKVLGKHRMKHEAEAQVAAAEAARRQREREIRMHGRKR